MKLLPTIATILSLSGAMYGALGMPLEMNAIWLVSNAIWIHILMKEKSSSVPLWIVYWFIALFGVLNLSGMI